MYLYKILITKYKIQNTKYKIIKYINYKILYNLYINY